MLEGKISLLSVHGEIVLAVSKSDTQTGRREAVQPDTNPTFKYISGFELSLLIAGYAIPAKFHTIGFSHRSNVNDASSMYSTTSIIHTELISTQCDDLYEGYVLISS